MADLQQDMIDEVIRKYGVKDMVQLPGYVFNLVLERLRYMRAQAHGFKHRDPDNPATWETPEG